MEYAVYIGVDPKLRGEKALIRGNPDVPGGVLAQFDNMRLDAGKTNVDDCLAHGWTPFNYWNFETYEGTDY